MTIEVVVGAKQTNKVNYTFTANKVVWFQDADGKNTIYAKAATTWGSGTLTFYGMPEKTDTNKIALGLTMTADGFISIPATLGEIRSRGILAILTGSTNPDITLWVL